VIVGTEMIRAFPRPSSSETLSDCNDASIGNAVEAATLPLITSARSLLKSTVATVRLFFAVAGTGRSFLIPGGLFAGTLAENSCGFTVGFGLSTGPGCATTGWSLIAIASGGRFITLRSTTIPTTKTINAAATANPRRANGQ
jgi:hypothetical protein